MIILKKNKLKQLISQEINFIKNIFSVSSLSAYLKGDETEDDIEMGLGNSENTKEQKTNERARNITELQAKLQKIKTQNKYSLKGKLVKKSLSSKLNKKIKKKERLNNDSKKKMIITTKQNNHLTEKKDVKIAKPVFNNEGKVVFSKFDFASTVRPDGSKKMEKNPKTILDNLNRQEKKLNQLEETKAEELKEKIAWKKILQKAEGQKVKDDPILLKKTIKRMEQKKSHSKKQWQDRIQQVEQKKENRQKKRRENISKKKKEKKSKIIKTAVKRGRVVI